MRRTNTSWFLTTTVLAACLSGTTGCGEGGRRAPARVQSPPAPASSLVDEMLAEATAGLVFDGDRVTVDPNWAAELVGHDAAVDLMRQGWSAMESGRRLAALRAFSRAVVAAPWLFEPYDGLGTALIRVKRFGRAVAAFSTALEIDGSRVETQFMMATVLQSAGRLDDAVDAWLEVVRHEPEHAEAHARLVAGFFLRGEPAPAHRHLLIARSLGANVPRHLEAILDLGAAPRAVVHLGPPAGEQGVASRPPLIGPQVRIDDNGGTGAANETTVAAADQAPSEIVAGWNDWRESRVRVGVSVSLDAGDTWTDFLLRPPPGNQSDVEGDPMTAADHRTGALWAGGVSYFGGGGLFVARKQAGSASFETPVMIYETDDFVDKGWMGTGPRPGEPDTTRLFVAYSTYLQYSDDMGAGWSSPVMLDYGFGHLPRLGPASELYIGYWDTLYGINLQRSFDGGDSVEAPISITTRIDTDVEGSSYPGGFRVWPFTYIAVDRSNGTLYCVWHDVTGTTGGNNNVDLLFSKSTDQGATWTTPVVVNGDGDPPGDQFFPWLEVDRWGRLHMLFLDTRHTLQDDSDYWCWIDAYYSTSDDGGATWTEYRLTPESFQVSDQFIGDYCGLTVAGNNVYPVYPSTQNGDLDIFSHTIVIDSPFLFVDGFESGDESQWSAVVGA